MEALFETVAKDTKKGLRDRVILELLYATGIRVLRTSKYPTQRY